MLSKRCSEAELLKDRQGRLPSSCAQVPIIAARAPGEHISVCSTCCHAQLVKCICAP